MTKRSEINPARRRLFGLALVALLPFPALAAPRDTLAYLKGGSVWVEVRPGQGARQLPGSEGAVLLDLSPTSGTVAFLTGPAGAGVTGERVPPLMPFLSKAPYTLSISLSRLVPDPSVKTVRARWLMWEGDGRNLVVGTDAGTVAWDLVKRRTFTPNQTPLYQRTSRDSEVTVTSGSVQSTDEPGVLLYGPGARPGTEVFTLSQPQNLMTALSAQPQATMRAFRRDLDPQAQRDAANWVTTPPQVTSDGKHVYFASNVGYGVGSAGTTTYAVFEVDVASVKVRSLGWLGTFSGQVLEVLPSPDGGKLLILVSRHISNAQVPVSAYVADLKRQAVRELVMADAPRGHTSFVSGVCWLADGQHLALSVAYPRPQDLKEANGFEPGTREYTLLVKDATSGQVVARVPGATQPACGPASRS